METKTQQRRFVTAVLRRTALARSIVFLSVVGGMLDIPAAGAQAAPAGANAPAQAVAAQPGPGATAGSAAAPQDLGDIVVTARRREELLSRVPVSVTALTGATLQRAGPVSVETITRLAPSLNVMSSSGSRDNLIITIRGQGQTYGTQAPSVIPYYAEVPLQKLTTGFFYDLENLQVLRGPQGTLFGRNTDGGAILLQPKLPTNDFGGFLQAKYGTYDLKQITGAQNIPIVSDRILLRAAFDIARRDGYTQNLTLNSQLDNLHYESARLTAVVKPFDGLENDTSFAYFNAHERSGGTKLIYLNPALLGFFFNAFGFPPATTNALIGQAISDFAEQQQIGPRKTLGNAPALSDRRYYVLSNITKLQLNDDLLIKNVFGYVRQRDQLAFDLDATTLALVDAIPDIPTFYQEQFSEELQLQGRSLSGKLNWVAGGYYDHSSPPGRVAPTNVQELVVLRLIQPTVNTSESKAGFAQGTYDLGALIDGLKFTAGGRYTHETVGEKATQFLNGQCQPGFPVPSCTIDFTPRTFNEFTWNLGLDYQLDPDTLVYVSAHRGYKTGGFNVTFPSPDVAFYKPEVLVDQEVGLKKSFNWGGVRARVNVDAYHGKYHDSQKVVTLAANGQAYTFVANVPSATVQGVEFEGLLYPISGLLLKFNYAYTDAHYDQGLPSFPTSTHFGATPAHQLNASARYTWELGHAGALSVGGEFYHQSAMSLVDNDATVLAGREAPYSLVNADIALEKIGGTNLSVSAFVSNATNQTYQVGQANISNSLGLATALYGAPRMYGVAASYHW